MSRSLKLLTEVAHLMQLDGIFQTMFLLSVTSLRPTTVLPQAALLESHSTQMITVATKS